MERNIDEVVLGWMRIAPIMIFTAGVGVVATLLSEVVPPLLVWLFCSGIGGAIFGLLYLDVTKARKKDHTRRRFLAFAPGLLVVAAVNFHSFYEHETVPALIQYCSIMTLVFFSLLLSLRQKLLQRNPGAKAAKQGRRLG